MSTFGRAHRVKLDGCLFLFSLSTRDATAEIADGVDLDEVEHCFSLYKQW